VGQRPQPDAIVKAVVDLAEALELKVIAEGVETKTQADRRAAAGCTTLQGFFYNQPVDAKVIADMAAGRMTLAA
jgi:EAL domain-containing protein (putative c-di-GMP-specific phosphodiesterase class I)